MVVLSQGVFTVLKLGQFFTMSTDYHHYFIFMHDPYNFSLFAIVQNLGNLLEPRELRQLLVSKSILSCI